ncbi:MAG TPA: PQQ-binding-like beta-propeller repeat protein [Ktedonobacterales bacterium]|nr:PQQ-binding-like beta-propeller repeat protein [Ktedonobacterales bacterium]
MHRFQSFWPPVLLMPLLLLGLAGCSGPCDANTGPNLDPNLVSANGLVYLNSPASHSLYAVEMSTGSIRWTYRASGVTLLDHDLLYIDDADYTMKSLDARTGALLWQKVGRNGSAVSTLFAATDHLAYIAGDDGLLEAVNGRDGTVLWHHVLKVDPPGSVTDDPASLQVMNGVVYLTTVSSSVYAFRERDGALLWQFNTKQGNRLNVLTSPAFGDGMVFLSADQTYALRLSDGKLLWRSAHKGGLLEANGILYLDASRFLDPMDPTGSLRRVDSVFALQASDGTLVWQRSFAPPSPGEHTEVHTMQLLEHGLVIFSTSASDRKGFADHLFALSASNGTQVWEDALPDRRYSFRAWQGVLYLISGINRVSGPGLLEALRETDGAVLWSRSLQQVGVLITNDAIYAGIGGNTDPQCAPVSSAQLAKLQLSDASPIWQRQLDPAPDLWVFTKRIFVILGGLLSLLGLLAFLVARKGRPKAQLPSPLPEESALAVPVASVSGMLRLGWLLLFVPGIVLLLVAALMAVQGIH